MKLASVGKGVTPRRLVSSSYILVRSKAIVSMVPMISSAWLRAVRTVAWLRAEKWYGSRTFWTSSMMRGGATR